MAPALPDFAAPNEDLPRPDRQSALVLRNISVRGRRISIRLEPEIWDTLAEICRRELCTPNDVCSYVDERTPPHGSLAMSNLPLHLQNVRCAHLKLCTNRVLTF